jgi:hypothetical protein
MLQGTLIATCAALVSATGCVDYGEEPREWKMLGDAWIDGGIWGFAIDPERQPLVTTLGGIKRYDGSAWVSVPSDGLQNISTTTFDSNGTLYVRANQGTLWRRPPGTTAWEPFDDGQTVDVMPVEATDGVLYIGAREGEVLYREPGASAWSPTGYTFEPNAYPHLVADDEGNVWAQSQSYDAIRINRTQLTTYPAPLDRVLGAAVEPHLFLAVRDGVLYGGTHSYVERNGMVFSYELATGQGRALTDGTCHGGAPLVCDEDSPAEGGYVSQILWSPDGDVYQIWAGNNGAYPYLLRLRQGATRWEQLEDLGVPWQFGNGGLGLYLDGDRKYIGATQFTGSYNPGDGSVDPGGFYGYVYPM